MKALERVVYMPALNTGADGRYRSAVADAATSVSSYTQKRLQRYDVSDMISDRVHTQFAQFCLTWPLASWVEPGPAADRGPGRAVVRADTVEGLDMAYQGAASGRPDVLVEVSSAANSFGVRVRRRPARTATRLAGLTDRSRE